MISLKELADRTEQAKKAGQKVVYAHGVFDLLHVGHVRHLETARQHGSFLVVTITADAFVNKGPGRPAFPDYLRAEMLAALVHVDAVAINHEYTAENAIRLLKPDVYVKGAEYSDAQADVTGKITAEREAVESGGGKIVFTDEVTFSSSNLINRHFTTHDPSTHAFLDAMRGEGKLASLLKEIDLLSDLKVLVVGDTSSMNINTSKRWANHPRKASSRPNSSIGRFLPAAPSRRRTTSPDSANTSNSSRHLARKNRLKT